MTYHKSPEKLAPARSGRDNRLCVYNAVTTDKVPFSVICLLRNN